GPSTQYGNSLEQSFQGIYASISRVPLHQGEVMKTEDGWINVEDQLPPLKEMVQVFIDHSISPQAAFIKGMFNKPLQYVDVAKAMWYDKHYEDGKEFQTPRWGLGMVGGGPMGIYENVTHWKHLSEPPRK